MQNSTPSVAGWLLTKNSNTMTIKLDQKYKENERLEQALIDWDKEQIPFTIQQYLEHPFERTYTAEQMMNFARYYAQRCGVELERSKDE